MLTPLYARLSFVGYWALGMLSAYLAMFSRVQQTNIPPEVTYVAAGSAILCFAVGYIKLRKWFVQEDVVQRGASMLIQAHTENPETVHTEIKKALCSSSFMETLKIGIQSSKWSIHNDTTMKKAQLRVEFNFPEQWSQTPRLWCALGIIAGALPDGNKWGETGRENSRIVLTVVSPDGTTKTARQLAERWVEILTTAANTKIVDFTIEESYALADVPELKNNPNKNMLVPPKGAWSIITTLPKENLTIKISTTDGETEYQVLVASPTHSRTDKFTTWAAVLQIWGKFPEVKNAISDKFASLK